MASDFPTSLDPALATLRDDVDTFRANGLQHIADMVIAVQTLLGTDLGDMTSDPGHGASKQYGNLSQAMQALFRFQTGLIDFNYNPANSAATTGEPATTVNFTANRFKTAPFVIIQTLECHQDSGNDGMGAGTPSANGRRESKIYPINITKDSFGIAMSEKSVLLALAGDIDVVAHWLAFEPPFGFADPEETGTG